MFLCFLVLLVDHFIGLGTLVLAPGMWSCQHKAMVQAQVLVLVLVQVLVPDRTKES